MDFSLSIDHVDHFLFSVLVKTLNWLFLLCHFTDRKELLSREVSMKMAKKRIINVIIVFLHRDNFVD